MNVNGVSDLIYSKDSNPFGIPYSEWIGKWWQWHVSIPHNASSLHPRESYSPEKCAWNQDQNGPVWFLPDGRNLGPFEINNVEQRDCTVPQDKAILVQIYGGGCSFGEGFKTEKELEDCVNLGLDKVSFKAILDGTQVMSSANRYDYLSEHHKYNLTYVKDSLYAKQVTEGGTYKAMAGGYFLFLKPLSPGIHKLYFEETFIGPENTENRISKVSYNLEITK
jgi:hypothetical protein